METVGSGSMVSLFLNPALGEGEWSASRLCRFTPKETARGTNCTEGWIGFRTIWTLRRREFPYRESNPGSFFVHLLRVVAIPTELSRLKVIMYLRQGSYGGVDWIHLAEARISGGSLLT
jgi:hypothetical protein